jgi:hypothetical protein
MGIGETKKVWVVQHPNCKYLQRPLESPGPLYLFTGENREEAHHFPYEVHALLAVIRWSVETQTLIPKDLRVSIIESRQTVKETYIHTFRFLTYSPR